MKINVKGTKISYDFLTRYHRLLNKSQSWYHGMAFCFITFCISLIFEIFFIFLNELVMTKEVMWVHGC